VPCQIFAVGIDLYSKEKKFYKAVVARFAEIHYGLRAAKNGKGQHLRAKNDCVDFSGGA